MTTALVLIVLSLARVGVLLLTRRLMTVTRGNRGATKRAVTAKRRQFPRATRAELLEMVDDESRRDHARD